MRGKSKGDDQNEKMIRYLMKLPENRRCINCNSLGPQYVCTTFWTFICTNCSGVHREFTHRVKSVSMAKFTDEEVSALQAGGNEQARQTFLKSWDPVRNTLPHNTNTNKLRQFIKHVYEERRYTGDINRFSRLTLSEKDDPYKHKYSERYTLSKRNGDKNERLYKDERNACSLREHPRHGPSPSEDSSLDIVDESYRERNDRLLSRSATEMFTTADLPQDKFSRVHFDSRGVPTPHAPHSIQENVPTQRVEMQPKAKRGTSPKTSTIPIEDDQPSQSRNVRTHDSSIDEQQKVASPKKEPSNNEVAPKNKSTNSESLIDFTAQPEPPLVSSGDGDKIDVAPEVPYNNTLEYLLFEFSSPITPPCDNSSSQATSSTSNLPSSSSELALYDEHINPTTPKSAPTQTLENKVPTPSNVALVPTRSGSIVSNSPFSPTWMAQNAIQGSPHPVSPRVVTQHDEIATPQMAPTTQQFSSSQQCDNLALVPIPSTSSVPQPTSSINHNNQESQSNTTMQLISLAHKEAQEAADPSSLTQLISIQPNPNQRKEIPSDFFDSLSLRGPRAPFMWQNGPYNNTGYNMQYQFQYPAPFMQGPTFANPPRSTNPFDMNNDFNQGQPNTFPSMAFVQGSPSNNMPNPQGVSSASFGHQLQGAYIGQNFYNNMPPSRPQSQGSLGSRGVTEILGSIDLNQQVKFIRSAPANQSPTPSRAGNPFA